MKKFLFTTLILAISMSVSCAKKKKETMTAEAGFAQCDGTIGSFDVYTIASKTMKNTYELVLMTYEIADPGDIATITVANSQSGEYKTMVTQVVLAQDDEISAGYLSSTELDKYDVIAITPYDPTTNFANQVSDKDAICDLPYPGDGLDAEGNPLN